MSKLLFHVQQFASGSCDSDIQVQNLATHQGNGSTSTLTAKLNCTSAVSVLILRLQLMFCCRCSSVSFGISIPSLLLFSQLTIFSFIVMNVALD